jgi:predicted nucleic acid-binding protein
MGLVLDSGVLIAAEREAKPVSDLFLQLEQLHGETEVVISSIAVIELEHGLHRANTPGLARQRRAYLDTIFLAISVDPFTKEMGQLAAKIDAEARSAGLVIPFEDLLIGVTALHFGYGVCARNLRHFRMIPNLNVIGI